MDKVDLKRTSAYAARRGVFDTLEVGQARYLTIDGAGDPNTAPHYAAAVETLFATSYALKFLSKRELGRDYVVMPLEALWSAPDLRAFTSERDKTRWEWTAMILVPEWIESAMIDAARLRVSDAPAAAAVRVTELTEGLCVQTLHVGPYDDEGPVLAEMHERVIPGAGLRMRGRHHEIYLGDVRRADPRRLRTILRQPVEPA